MALVKVENVRKRYALGAASVLALDGVSAEIEEGAFLAIAGPSGSGKSTLLNIIGCIDTADEGSVAIDGVDVSGQDPDNLADLRARRIGFIFQTFNLLPVLSALENVEFPLLHLPELSRSRAPGARGALPRGGRPCGPRRQPAEPALRGQRQRVAIARALATRPRLVLADEPTANLDQATGGDILDAHAGHQPGHRHHLPVSTHDRQVMTIADRLLHMVDGRFGERPLPRMRPGRRAGAGKATPSPRSLLAPGRPCQSAGRCRRTPAVRVGREAGTDAHRRRSRRATALPSFPARGPGAGGVRPRGRAGPPSRRRGSSRYPGGAAGSRPAGRWQSAHRPGLARDDLRIEHFTLRPHAGRGDRLVIDSTSRRPWN